MNRNDSPHPAGRGESPDDQLARELRGLRLEDPSPELRRRTLVAAGEALAEREGGGLAGWWRELALAGAALLLFAVSLPTSLPSIALPSLPAWSSPTAAQIVADNAELTGQLGVEADLAEYFEKKSLAGAIAARSGRPSPSRSPTLNDPS